MSKLIDLDNEALAPKEGGNARIATPGIHTNVKFLGVTYIDNPADAAKNKKAWRAAEFLFENQNGEQHKELYMEPVSDPTQVKNPTKWYDDVNGKKVNTRKATEEEHVKIFNNNFIYFLIDLGHALGYGEQNVLQVLKKAVDFKSAVELFKKNFPPGKGTINVRILYQNNDPYNGKPGSSWLKIHNMYLGYYPYKSDLFEPYVEGRPSGLFISEYDYKNGMTEKYPYQRPQGPQTNEPIVGGGTQPAFTPGASAPAGAAEVDPF